MTSVLNRITDNSQSSRAAASGMTDASGMTAASGMSGASAVSSTVGIPAALEIRGLTKDFGDFKLNNMNLTIPAGCIVGLIGENGAGKTTTIKAAMGLIHPDSGSVRFYGQALADNPIRLKEDISVVFDNVHFNKTFTVKQIGAICRSVYSNWDDRAWNGYLDQFKLPQNKIIKDFSKGMLVKLNLAMALSHNAKLLLLDEPTAGLDPVMRDDILDIFLEFIQDESHTILISSHITSDLEKIADYIAFLHEGHLVFCEPKDELLYNYGVIRCGREDFTRIEPEDRIAVRRQEYQYNILVSDRQAAARKYPSLVIDPPTIDEIMLFYVKGEK